MYSKSIQQLIEAFSKLPSVGERTAERFVFYLLKSGKKEATELVLSLKNLIDNIKSCEICWDFSDSTPCKICGDKNRDHSIVCVVADSQDLQAIERTNAYHGTYHVLRGLIKTDEELSLGKIKIRELITRLKNPDIKEVILALNPNLSGETTMMFLEKKIKAVFPNIKISRLARGLPMGSDLQYADEITLESSIKNRSSR